MFNLFSLIGSFIYFGSQLVPGGSNQHKTKSQYPIHSFGYFYSTSSSTTPRCSRLQHLYCARITMPKHYKQLLVKDCPRSLWGG